VKVLTVLGTRPEAIKLAPVIRELRRRAGSGLQSAICTTAQHRDLLDQALALFGLVPDHDLAVMERDQALTAVAAAVLARLEPVLALERPDWVLVQGDTTTVAAAALAAYYAGARVGHVEAGLRTGDKWQPFPEEINRRVASVLADLHFAPTEGARDNLLREAVPPAQIIVTGNPVIDALHWMADLPSPREVGDVLLHAGIRCGEAAAPEGSATQTPARRLILVTAHRRENFGAPLEAVCAALRDVAERYAGAVQVVYAVHPNPNVCEPVHRLLDGVPNVTLTPPLAYSTLVHLMRQAYLVLTDSGGIQEEAPGLGVPVLVLRDVTERPEAVEAGTVRLVGTERAAIVAETCRLLDNPAAHARMAQAVNPYGDGRASSRIVAALLGESVEPFRPPARQVPAESAAAYRGRR
jgi:UDP-N-acetylglucosamine 2-epimerase (non-hydrolysing)